MQDGQRPKDLDNDVFAPDKMTGGASGPKKPRYWLWAIPVIGLLLTIALFVVLEQRIAAKQREAAIDVLRNTQPSEFMPKRN